jgi:hypothetical protein
MNPVCVRKIQPEQLKSKYLGGLMSTGEKIREIMGLNEGSWAVEGISTIRRAVLRCIYGVWRTIFAWVRYAVDSGVECLKHSP